MSTNNCDIKTSLHAYKVHLLSAHQEEFQPMYVYMVCMANLTAQVLYAKSLHSFCQCQCMVYIIIFYIRDLLLTSQEDKNLNPLPTMHERMALKYFFFEKCKTNERTK